MNVLRPIIKFFSKPTPKPKDQKLSTLTNEKIFLENGYYKIKDEYSKGGRIVTLCKYEEGEEFANARALTAIRESFDNFMYSFVQNP